MYKILKYKLLWLFICLMNLFSGLIAQEIEIDIETAIDIAQKNYPALRRDELKIEQKNQMVNGAILPQQAQIFLTGEEFLPGSNLGIHSLNIQQNFYLPKAVKAQKSYYKEQAYVAQNYLELTNKDLKKKIRNAYFNMLYANSFRVLAEEEQEMYRNFTDITAAKLDKGEIGKIPNISSRSRLAESRLTLEHAEERYQIAVKIFNLWLNSDTTYISTLSLHFRSYQLENISLTNNPHLKILAAQKQLAEANIGLQESLLNPQINSGFRLQSAFGNFPLLGYQIGINIPIFRKPYESRIQSAKVGVLVEEKEYETTFQYISVKTNEIMLEMEHLEHIISQITKEIHPLLEEEVEATLQAFNAGEGSFRAYLDSAEALLDSRYRYLENILRYYNLETELKYWQGL
jgi:cobalt-zinc-cadmium resistance protein CzcA